MMKLKRKPVDMCIIQVYMLTTECSEKEVYDMYEKTEQLLDDEIKAKDYTVVIGDFNAVVGISAIVVWDIIMIVVRCW